MRHRRRPDPSLATSDASSSPAAAASSAATSSATCSPPTPTSQVVNLDALTYAGNPENLADVEAALPGRYRFIHGDIRDHEAVRAGHGRLRHRGPLRRREPRGPLHRPGPRLHHHQHRGHLRAAGGGAHAPASDASSTSPPTRSTAPSIGSFTEDDPLAPSSPYSASKAAADLLVLSYRTHLRAPGA